MVSDDIMGLKVVLIEHVGNNHMHVCYTYINVCVDTLRMRETSVFLKEKANKTWSSENFIFQPIYLFQQIAERKEGILQSVSVQKQYEQMLKDFAEFLETANDKVKIETLSFNSQEELKKQLASHQVMYTHVCEKKAKDKEKIWIDPFCDVGI